MGALCVIKQHLTQTVCYSRALAEEMQSNLPFQMTVKGVSCGWWSEMNVALVGCGLFSPEIGYIWNRQREQRWMDWRCMLSVPIMKLQWIYGRCIEIYAEGRASTLSALHHLLFTASWWQAKTVTDILPPAQHLQTSPPNQIKTTSSDAPAIIIYSYIFSEVCVTPSGLMSNSFSFDFEAAPFPPSHFLNLRQTRTAPWPGDLN